MGNGFYKDDKHLVVPFNPDAPKASKASTASPDVAAAFVSGATYAKGRGQDPVQVSVNVTTGQKRQR